jgi:ATP/maltotriose-dependent transcriptional regulator MalT/DNA-binding SARP family transcriptional activator
MDWSTMQHLNGRPRTVIERIRLMALRDHVFSHPITLISAPVGCGKTTLAGQFAASSPFPVIWHALEADQRDLTTLHLKATAAIGDAFPHAGLRPPTPAASPERLGREILRFLSAQRGGVLYVLEDIHHLEGAGGAERWLEELITHLPPGVCLVITSETVPAVIPRERIARKEVLPINANTLAFTPDEALKLADVLGTRYAPDQVLALRDQLEGWAAGLALAFQPGVQGIDDPALFDMARPEALFDLLAQRLFVVQPPPMQEFLLAASALDPITPEALISALNLPNVMSRLAQAQDAGLFLTPTRGGVVMHRLFRAFLQREFRARHPERWRAVHHAIAAWHESRLNIGSAVVSRLLGEDVPNALRLIDTYARALYDRGERETLFRWEAALEEAGADSAWLRYLCAALLVSGMRYAEGQARIDRARALFTETDDREGLARVTLLEAHIILMRGEYDLVFRVADALVSMDELPLNLLAAALRLRALARLYNGETALALVDFERALPLYEEHCDEAALTKLLGDMDMAYRRAGRIDDAAVCLSRIVRIRRQTPGQAELPTALNQYGVLLHMQGDLSLAGETLNEGAALAMAQGDRRAEAYLRWSLGDLERDRANFDEAIGHYNNALRLAGEDEPLVRCGVLIGLSMLLRWRGNALDALSHLDEAAALADEHRLVLEGLQVTIARCALAPLAMPTADAIAALNAALDRLRAMHATTEAAGGTAVLALLYLLHDDRAAAERALEAVDRLIRAGALPQPAAAELVFAPPPLRKLLSGLGKRAETLYNTVQSLKKQTIRPANILSLPLNDAPSTTSLTVYVLGREIYERDGALVLHTEWRAHSARSLFLSLLLEGPQRREALTVKLFSAVEAPSRARSNFHTTLHRAREVLGANVILYRENEDVYLINPEVSIWCDALVFEQAVRDARGKPRRDPMLGEMWRRARALYHGTLLPDYYEDWAEEYRRHFDALYLETLLASGEIAHEQLDFATAEEMYRKAISMDELNEDTHLCLLRLWRDADQKHRIQPHYNKFYALTMRELGHPPSPKMAQWVRNLII